MSLSLFKSIKPTTRVSPCLYSTKVLVKDTGVPDPKVYTQQAPNRIAPWSRSQQPRDQVQTGLRFVQRDLSKQPKPYSAMELIAKQPIRYLEHTNIAVCNGNKGSVQGHPKIFINLDPARPHACGYCGLRFAKAEFKEAIEAKES